MNTTPASVAEMRSDARILGETAVILFEVVIPDQATPGDHVAGICASLPYARMNV